MHHMTPLRKALNYVLPQVTQLRVQATGRAPLIKMLNILSSQLGGRTLPEVLGLQVNFLLRYAEPLAAKQCLVQRDPPTRHPLHTEDDTHCSRAGIKY